MTAMYFLKPIVTERFISTQVKLLYIRKFCLTLHCKRRGARVVEEVRLESVCTPKGYRGFESLPLRNYSLLSANYNYKALKKVLNHLI